MRSRRIIVNYTSHLPLFPPLMSAWASCEQSFYERSARVSSLAALACLLFPFGKRSVNYTSHLPLFPPLMSAWASCEQSFYERSARVSSLAALACLLFPFGKRSEFVRNPSDCHTQTPQKPERADESRTQTHRNQTARPVGRSGY